LGAFFLADGSGIGGGAEGVDSVCDADAFFFAIHPRMKQTFLVWYHKTFAETMAPNGSVT
jgi:hypothetical protein